MKKRYVNAMTNKFHELAKAKGFWDDKDPNDMISQLATLALIGTEVSEAVQAIRKGDTEELKYELADIMIRVYDFAGSLGIDVDAVIEEKHRINESRPRKHGRLI